MCSTISSASSWAAGARGGKIAARDLRYNLEISLEEAFRGRQAQIKVPSAVACEACSGTGAESGTKPEQCPTCSGIGKVRAQQGFFTIERSCPNCRGQGRIIRNPCKTCRGSGHVQKERTLAVDIPAGVEEGTRIRLAGEGQAGVNGGPTGDLYIFISVTPHQIFQRDGHDLYCRAPVSFITAALGGAIEVPTPDGGRTKVSMPEGTQTGHQFRMRGKGMPVLRGGGIAGDLYVEVAVETPVKLSKKQKELLRNFEKESAPGSQPESEGFFAKVKEFWDGGRGRSAPRRMFSRGGAETRSSFHFRNRDHFEGFWRAKRASLLLRVSAAPRESIPVDLTALQQRVHVRQSFRRFEHRGVIDPFQKLFCGGARRTQRDAVDPRARAQPAHARRFHLGKRRNAGPEENVERQIDLVGNRAHVGGGGRGGREETVGARTFVELAARNRFAQHGFGRGEFLEVNIGARIDEKVGALFVRGVLDRFDLARREIGASLSPSSRLMPATPMSMSADA